MYEKEIKNFNWDISPDLKINKTDLKNLEKIESEAHINIMRCGLKDENIPEIIIDCSYQKFILKFSKSHYFTLTEILISTINIDKKLGGFILSINGIMPINGISIRNKKIITEKEMERRRKLSIKMSMKNKKKSKRD